MEAALTWAERTSEEEAGLRLAAALQRYWYFQGYNREGSDWLERVLALGQNASASARAPALRAAGGLAYQRGDLARAQALYTDQIALEEACGNRSGIAGAVANLGNIALTRGDLTEARLLFERALALFEELNDLSRVAMVRDNLAIVACTNGDFALACAHHEASIRQLLAVGERQQLAIVYNNLASTRITMGDRAAALDALRESRRLCQALENRHSTAQCLMIHAVLAAHDGQMESAAVLLGGGDALREKMGLPLLPAAEFQACRETARTHLGAEAFAARAASGSRLTIEQLLAYAEHALDQELPHLAI